MKKKIKKKSEKKQEKKKKHGTLGGYIKKAIKTVISWYTPDENGKTNRVAQVCFGFGVLLPLVLLEGIKLGVYSKYSSQTAPVAIMAEGILIPAVKVFFFHDDLQVRGFGTQTKAFNGSFLFMFLFIFAILFAIMFIQADLYSKKSSKSKGEAKFGKWSEFNKNMAYCNEDGEPIDPPENSYEPGNMILSRHIRYSLEPQGTNTYSCALVIGATGSGKSFTYCKPNLLQMNSSYIVTDPKGELTSDVGAALMRHGYEVKVFNINEPEYSCRYNIFRYIRCEADVVAAVDVFLENTKQTDSGGDAFFELAEKNFYLALFFYVYTVYKDQPEKQTLKTIYELYQKSDEQEIALKKGETAPLSEFDEMFTKLGKEDPSNPALPYYATFKKGSMKTKQSILISVGVKLWFMSVGTIANLLSGDDLELEKIGDRKTALFIITPSEKSTYKFLTAMLFTQLFETLYYVGNTLNEKSWLLQKENCIALRSDPFIAGTQSEKDAKDKLIKQRESYARGYIEDDEELMKTDPKVKKFFETRNEEGFLPFPRARLVTKDEETGEKKVLVEFQSRAQADMFYDAIMNGDIVRGKKELTNHVRFMLDEFFSLGKIDNFDLKIATFRSLRISCDIIVQSITQLKELYEDREAKITNNCSIQILLGAASMDDCQYFSDMAGQNTVQQESYSITRKGLTPGLDGGNLSDTDELVLRPEAIREFNKDKCLIFVNTQKPIWDMKYNSLDHPRWKETYSSKDIEHTIQNQFQFRRLFYIKQDDKNRIVTTLKDPAAATPAVGQDTVKTTKKLLNVIKGIDPDKKSSEPDFFVSGDNKSKTEETQENKTAAPVAQTPAPEFSDKWIGVDTKPDLKDMNRKYESEMEQNRTIEDLRDTIKNKFQGVANENGDIPVAALGSEVASKLINMASKGDLWKIDPGPPKEIVPTENNKLAQKIKKGFIKEEQIIKEESFGDLLDNWVF